MERRRRHSKHARNTALGAIATALLGGWVFALVGCGILDWEDLELPRGRFPDPRRPDGGGSGVVRFELPGSVHVPRPGSHNRTVDFRARGAYRRATLELDVTHGGWFAAEPHRNHSLFWLHRGRGAYAGNAVAYVNAFGPPRNEVRLATNLARGRGERMDSASARGIQLQSGRTYHLRYLYDGAAGRTELVVSEGGRVLTRIAGRAPLRTIQAPADGVFFVSFGHKNNGSHGPERPTYGWRYANLEVELVP